MATTAKDILLDDNGVLRIEHGDFVVGASDGQHMKLILLSEQGAWRRTPLVGVGIRRAINVKMNGLKALTLKKRIYSQMEADGYKVNKAVVTENGKLILDCDRI